jgi:hypothetical protein
MPLEIRELIIRVTVNDQVNKNSNIISEDKILEIKNKVVKECMDKLLTKIERINER